MINKKGFTLIEVIVSLAIIGIISVSVFSALNVSLMNIVRAGNITTSTEDAEEIMLTKVNETTKDVSVKFSFDGSNLETVTTTAIEISGYSVIKGSADSVEIETYIRP